MSIINSGVVTHQFTISVHEQGLHNLLVVCIEVFMFVWFVYHVNTVHVYVVLTCSECSVHALLLCTLVPVVMALFPCVPCHVTCMCMCLGRMGWLFYTILPLCEGTYTERSWRQGGFIL